MVNKISRESYQEKFVYIYWREIFKIDSENMYLQKLVKIARNFKIVIFSSFNIFQSLLFLILIYGAKVKTAIFYHWDPRRRLQGRSVRYGVSPMLCTQVWRHSAQSVLHRLGCWSGGGGTLDSTQCQVRGVKSLKKARFFFGRDRVIWRKIGTLPWS